MERDKLKQVFGQETVGVGFLGLPEAPVFYPSEEEFKDPLEFIDQIRSKAEPYGICRIVPPKSWNPPFALDSRSFSFPTKVQSIHQLQVRPAACDAETFKLEYSRFLLKTGRRVENWPIFCGKELDLSKFFSAVKRHGGYQKVVNDKKWGEVLQILEPACIPSALSNSLLSALSQAYENYLYEYELFQSSFSCGKRFRTSNMQDERCRSRGKRAARNVSAHMAESVALRVDVDKLGLNKGASEMTVPCSGSQCISPADLLGKSKQVKIEEVTTSDGEFKADQVCEQCHSGAHEHLMLLCDRCDRGWHLYCLTPPLSSVPAGNWYCSDCITSERESFGFSPGLGFNLDSFRRIADRFKRKWFGTRQASCYKIEEEFWKVVDRVKGPVEVFYGSDLDTASYGSGFPRSSDPIPEWADENGWKEHAANPWNLNNFAKTNGSLLRYVQENIPGVIVPWIYIGMLFSSFCWHYEDQCFYSINYLHWGEPKCWYSVPGNAADLFEQVMHKTFPDLFEAQPDLLFQLVTMLNPKVLCENDVPVCTTIQERGNFVITFPRSYHGGFNHGFNCAEAVNFATVDWLPFGWFGVERYRLYHKAAVLSHDELVCVVAKNSGSNEMSPWVKKDLIRMIALERKQRERLWKIGVVRSSRMVPRMHPDVIGTEEDPECIICRYYLFLSAVTCNCSPGKAVCIQHAEHLCECSTDQQQLLYRFSLAELNDLLLLESENSAVCKSDISLTDSGKVKQRRRSRHSESPSIPMTAMKKVKGHLMSHTKLAEVWISKARNALCRTSHLSSIQGLLEEAEQFLWAGHEMDSVRMVEKDLIYVQSWAQDVASCIHVVKMWLEAGDCNPAKVCFVTAQQLVSVDPLPCIEDHFSKLKALVESAIRLQQQTKASFLSVPPLELTDLKTLQQEVLQSPFEFSEAMRLKNVIDTAQAWGEEVQKILSHCGTCRNVDQRNRMDLNKLHLLQLEGYKLPVSIPEKQVVDAVIKKVEVLTECLQEVLSTTVSLQEAEDLLHKIEELPVHIPQAELLEQWRYETQEWKKYARKVLADVQQQKDCFVCIELLSPLLETGECLKLGVEELDLVKAELRKFSWLDKASKALESPSSSKTLMDILEEGAKLSLGNERLYLQICSVVEAAQIWESKAALFLEKGACLDDYRNLKSASDSIQTPLSGLGAINTVIMQAESWLLRAQPFVSHNQGNPHKFTSLDLRTLKSLVIESQSLKVSLDEIGLLQIALEEITAWRQSATVLLFSAKELLLSGQGKAQLCTGTPEEDIMLKKIILDNQEQLADLQSKVKDGLAFGFELQEIAELQILCAATEWNLKCLKLLLNSPTIQELELLIYEASSFSEYVGQLALLQNILHNARAWLEKVTVALHRRDPVLKFTVQQLEKFLTEAQALRVSLSPDVAYVENLLNAHKAWRKQILQYLDSQNFSISWADLHDLQKVGEASQVKSEEMDILVVEVVKVDNWILRCYEVLMGQSGSSSLLLKDILLKMQTSLDMGLQQVQGMMTTEMESLCCVCREYLDLASSSVLQCDNCKDRYHSSCPGCVQTQTRAQKQSLCPFCTAFITGVLCVHEKVYSKICTTKRPTLAALLELLNAAEGIRFRTEEFELLQRTVRKVEEWQACVRNISEPLLVQCNNQSNVDYTSLLASLKVMGTIEVKEDEGSKLKLAIAVNAWRMRARVLLESPSRPLYRSLSRILKEGLAVPVPAEDCFLDDLKKREQLASEWTSRAKEAIGDDGAMPVEEVCNLIVEGERLPVTLGKELTALRARTVLYCICRKPYDDERAMIACDCCSEWYHFDCVNLPEPDSSDDECEVLLQRVGSSGEFYCPNCKKFENKDASRLVNELVENSDGVLKDGNGMHGTICTPPFRYARGKRSSRTSMKVKTDLQQRWGSSTILSMFSKERSKNAAEHCQTCLNASGRPCRRTAGQHRGFESFVLLTRSR